MTERVTDPTGFRRRPRILDYIGAGGLSDDEAREFAHDLVRRARSEVTPRHTEAPAPEPKAVRERREERLGSETSHTHGD